jgi:N-acyl-D-aspartate/D-glutamate deacylase
MAGSYDTVIKDATIVDGTGGPKYSGDISLQGERIASVGRVRGPAGRTIDASGLIASPGFVDPHSHADLTILGCPLADNLVVQGITTFAGGNCGISLAPLWDKNQFEELARVWHLDVELRWRSFGEWLSAVEDEGIAANYIPLVGHNTIRGAVMGDDFTGEADTAQTQHMRRYVFAAMEEGAFGLSVGLDAAMTGHFARRDELIELVRAAGERGGIFSPHARHHQHQWPAESPDEVGYGLYHGPRGEIITGRYHGLVEVVEIARAAGCNKLHIAHLTPSYVMPQPHPGYIDEVLARATLEEIIEGASDAGIDASFNVIAWEQSIGSELPMIKSFFSSQLVLPQWLRKMGREDFVQSLGDRSFRERVREVILSGKFKFGMLNPNTDPYWMDCYRIVRCGNGGYVGSTIGELARERSPGDIFQAVYRESFDTVFDLLQEDPDTTWALIRDKREYGALSTFLKHPSGMPCTDVPIFRSEYADADAFYGYGVSPSAFGLFPHYIRRFIRDEGTLGLEEGIRKITSLPLRKVFGVQDRGTLAEGMYADMVLFDYEHLQEHNDFQHPSRYPDGIKYVFVNGRVVYNGNGITGERTGKVLRRNA